MSRLSLLSRSSSSSTWQLVFEDQFDGTGLPSTSDWNILTGPHFAIPNFIFTNRDVNIAMSGGQLALTARHETYQGYNYTGGGLATGLTGTKHQWLYGRFECRCKVGTGHQWWPAFWMLGDAGGPREIDIMEYNTRWSSLNVFNTRVHADKYGSAAFTVPVSDLNTAYHTFRLDWTRGKLEFFLDDVSYGVVTGPDADFFNSPMYVLLDGAIDVTNTNMPPVSLPKSFLVDFVRVWQQSET